MELHGTAEWPGTEGLVESCSYTCSHGITPGTATLSCHAPLGWVPAMLGDLLITDGQGAVLLPGCRVDDYTFHQDGGGSVMTLSIRDRRWRWAGGRIDGCYNQLDPHGKLIPWTIRSPRELALLCLAAMGEAVYDIEALPPGINYPGPRVLRPIINVSGVNPPVNWYALPPAQALQQVAETFGCRVAYDPSTDSVRIVRVGQGALLPDGSLAAQGPSLKPPDAPSAVVVVGAPTVFQVRLPLVPVGEEWDGSYVPIDLLSYAPPADPGSPGKAQQWAVNLLYGVEDVAVAYDVWLGAVGLDDAKSGILFTVAPMAGDVLAAAAAMRTDLMNQINASTDFLVQNRMKATVDGSFVVITGVEMGYAFKCAAAVRSSFLHPDHNTIEANVWQVAEKPFAGDNRRWKDTDPGFFFDVTATDRLTYTQARALAVKSVFRTYQIATVGLGKDKKGRALPLLVPGYEYPIERRQQIVLTNEQVDQVVPFDGKPDLFSLTSFEVERYQADFYNGYSKGKAAAVYGSVAEVCINNTGIYIEGDQDNTDVGSVVPVPFTTQEYYQLVVFSSHVWRYDDEGADDLLIGYPDLVLQTGVKVRDAQNNQFSGFSRSLALPTGNPLAPPRVEMHEDVQANVTSTYDDKNNLTNVALLEADPIIRAGYYLDGMAYLYDLKAGQTARYNGIVPVQIDGAIMQATWSVGPGGAETLASRNYEHSPYIPPYPARRRAEFLPPPANGGPQKIALADEKAGRG